MLKSVRVDLRMLLKPIYSMWDETCRKAKLVELPAVVDARAQAHKSSNFCRETVPDQGLTDLRLGSDFRNQTIILVPHATN